MNGTVVKKQKDPSEETIRTPKVETWRGGALGSYHSDCRRRWALLTDLMGSGPSISSQVMGWSQNADQSAQSDSGGFLVHHKPTDG